MDSECILVFILKLMWGFLYKVIVDKTVTLCWLFRYFKYDREHNFKTILISKEVLNEIMTCTISRFIVPTNSHVRGRRRGA